MLRAFEVNIVSPEESLFSGKAQKLFVTGIEGELEILYGHTPFLTRLKPGAVWIVSEEAQEQVLYVSGGILEVQPKASRILADVAIRAEELDEAQALAAKKRAEEILGSNQGDIDYAKAQLELQETMIKLRLLQKFRSAK